LVIKKPLGIEREEKGGSHLENLLEGAIFTNLKIARLFAQN